MKKRRITAIALVLLVSLAGCAAQTKPYDDMEQPKQPESSVIETPILPETDSEFSLLAGENQEEPAVSQPVLPQESSTNSQQPEETKQSADLPAPKQEERPIASEKSPAPEPPKAAEPTPEPKPEPTPPPAQQPPKVEQPETPAITPTPSESEPPAFDISTYVQAAKDYGTEIGLAQDSAATACWDDPLTANARCQYLERDLRDRLDWYKESGFTAFWVWAEPTGDSEYLLYIGYA